MTAGPEGELAARLERILGTGGPPPRWTAVERGYTPARRWIARFHDGSSAFLKVASDARTAEWLRAEHRIYSQVSGDYLPRMLGWDDDGERPVLVLEDLSGARWPPPWHPTQVQGVLETLSKVRATPPPPGVAPLDRSSLAGWKSVEEDPVPFLTLGLCSADWLDHTLPALIGASDRAAVEGDDLVHRDVRSDNLCFAGNRVLLVDWNLACRANGLLDIAAWLPSLHAEGGPTPEQVLPDAPEYAAFWSGFFAARAGLPPIEGAPRVRTVQLQQLRTALPWAVRALGLRPPDG